MDTLEQGNYKQLEDYVKLYQDRTTKTADMTKLVEAGWSPVQINNLLFLSTQVKKGKFKP